MRKRSIVLVTGALVLVASLVIGPAATAKPERTRGRDGYLRARPGAVHAQPVRDGGKQHPDAAHDEHVLAFGAIYNNKAALVPQLWDGAPKILKDPLTVTWKYKQSAVWSDGQPVMGAGLLRHIQDEHEPELRHHRPDGLGGHHEASSPRASR